MENINSSITFNLLLCFKHSSYLEYIDDIKKNDVNIDEDEMQNIISDSLKSLFQIIESVNNSCEIKINSTEIISMLCKHDILLRFDVGFKFTYDSTDFFHKTIDKCPISISYISNAYITELNYVNNHLNKLNGYKFIYNLNNKIDDLKTLNIYNTDIKLVYAKIYDYLYSILDVNRINDERTKYMDCLFSSFQCNDIILPIENYITLIELLNYYNRNQVKSISVSYTMFKDIGENIHISNENIKLKYVFFDLCYDPVKGFFPIVYDNNNYIKKGFIYNKNFSNDIIILSKEYIKKEVNISQFHDVLINDFLGCIVSSFIYNCDSISLSYQALKSLIYMDKKETLYHNLKRLKFKLESRIPEFKKYQYWYKGYDDEYKTLKSYKFMSYNDNAISHPQLIPEKDFEELTDTLYTFNLEDIHMEDMNEMKLSNNDEMKCDSRYDVALDTSNEKDYTSISILPNDTDYKKEDEKIVDSLRNQIKDKDNGELGELRKLYKMYLVQKMLNVDIKLSKINLFKTFNDNPDDLFDINKEYLRYIKTLFNLVIASDEELSDVSNLIQDYFSKKYQR